MATCQDLRKWNKEVFGLCQVRINTLIRKISDVQNANPSNSNGKIEAVLQAKLREWLMRSEVLWRQKSRELWLKEGDKSIKFFHLSTIIRHRQNNIDAIRSKEGNWITDKGLIRQHFLDNFRHHFTAEEVNFPDHLHDLVSAVISEEDNIALRSIPTPKEIKSTLFHMPNLKALGPDGFPVAFYKSFWPIVGDDVTKAVTSFFTIGSMPKEINSSFIVLILKVPNLSSFNHYMPISLCNVVYKIIPKILVSRIKPLLPSFISPC